MNRDNALLVAQIVDRIIKLEKTILELNVLMSKNSFVITGSNQPSIGTSISVNLEANEIATVVFTQDILEMFINTLNLELNELISSLEKF
jgi:hypothetical protein